MKKAIDRRILRMKTTARKLFSYEVHSALDVVKVLNAVMTVSKEISSKNNEFVVFNKKGVPLPGKCTAKMSGVFIVRLHINQVLISEVKEFSAVLKGLGKLKGFQLINPCVKPQV
jgi:hypothetical protein